MIKKLIRLKFNPFGWVHMMDSSILILIRLKINAFLVSFPFMIKKLIRLKFNPFGWVHMMDSSIMIFNWLSMPRNFFFFGSICLARDLSKTWVRVVGISCSRFGQCSHCLDG